MTAFKLADAAIEAGHGVLSFETLGSTTDQALAQARAGVDGPLWIVARTQTAGRGRRGSVWQTLEGNLATTLLWTDRHNLPPSAVATLGFVAGVALGKALRACCAGLTVASALDGAAGPDTGFKLKWPNDMLADGAKLAGIALEREGLGPDRQAVAVGIGVNVAAAPVGLPYPTTSLLARGFPQVTAAALFSALTEAWVATERVWNQALGFPLIREAWLAEAAGLGRPVAVRLAGSVKRGIFETIDDAGQLVIRDPDGARHVVAAGEVHFGVAASAAPAAV
ncbi:MAG TPA: biotin--[acetyl-CoA-carboxylase] ligase [Beijerinckiaceae bacterium]|jgi:BirA family biotin operon repressor/biotin-[acetyl-CoA-carboxylase] ligase